MSIAVLGAGAFGTALAISLAATGQEVRLWGRDAARQAEMASGRRNEKALPGAPFPDSLQPVVALPEALAAQTLLLAVPTQTLPALLDSMVAAGCVADGRDLVACCKGIDLRSLRGPVGTIRAVMPGATAAILTGPSFAVDIARGLPTALTLACDDPDAGARLQHRLATPTLRLYLSSDTAGAELGGAVKNVIAIAAGAAIGAGLGDSARAALVTRGFAEMRRLAPHFGGHETTLNGLSGLGDLTLTCTSDLSRNYRLGLALGRGDSFDAAITVEGAATARALDELAQQTQLDLPITRVVAALVSGQTDAQQAVAALLSRPLKEE